MVMSDARSRAGNDPSGSDLANRVRLSSSVPAPTVLVTITWGDDGKEPIESAYTLHWKDFPSELPAIRKHIAEGTVTKAVITITIEGDSSNGYGNSDQH